MNFENIVNFVDICTPRDNKWLVGCPILANNLDTWSYDLPFIAPVTPEHLNILILSLFH